MMGGFLSKVNKTILTLLLGCSILPACAIHEGQSGRRTVDMTHVNSINQQAEFRNIDIIWVNPPTRIETRKKTTIQIQVHGEEADSTSATGEEKAPQE
jgi:hypothetical protein